MKAPGGRQAAGLPGAPGLPALRRLLTLALLALLALTAACRSDRPSHEEPPRPQGRFFQEGVASWYGPGFAGRLTANGERFNPKVLTAAHKKLPFGSLVRVVNQDNGREVIVRINDRGPFVRRRVIDLSRAAAEEIGMVGPGVAPVRLYLIDEQEVQAAPEPTAAGPYTVQVGAFQESWRAHVLRAEIESFHPEVSIASDGVWHRVQVGLFMLRSEAEDLVRELAANGYQAAVVSVNPQ